MQIDFHLYVMNAPCIDLANAAGLLGVDKLTLKRYVESGEIECIHHGKVYRFSPQGLIAWYENKRVKESPRFSNRPFNY